MSTERKKAEVEITVFKEFIAKAKLSIEPSSIRKPGEESDPDIFCRFMNGEEMAYELVEICSPNIAGALSKIRSDSPATLVTSDPTERILRKKLHKNYRTAVPIELLCYTNGRTISMDELIAFEIQQWADAIDGPFRKIWLLGEIDACEVWSAPQ